MRKLKRSFGTFISFLLLLTLTVAVIPLDFYHNHSAPKQICSEAAKTGVCHHKLHLSEKSPSCWACAVHYDRTHTGPSFAEKIYSFPTIALLAENKVTGFFIKLIFTSLRGPPTE